MGVVSIPGLLVLGLLADRPWSAYDLVRHLSRPSLASVLWDVSERTLYREPQRLVEAGLATQLAQDEGPPLYGITKAGRAALRDARPDSGSFVYRNELLATLYATAGAPRSEILGRLHELRTLFLAGAEGTATLLLAMAARGPSIPSRAIVTALLGRIHVDGLIRVIEWADGAIDTLEELDAAADPDDVARREWAALAAKLDEVVAAHRADEGAAPHAQRR